MNFTVLTLFPEMIEYCLHTSILGKAIDKNLIDLRVINIRDYTDEKHGRVDDYTYGGGAGMLMQAQPVYDAWKSAVGDRPCRTVYVTPQGRPFTQRMAKTLSHEEELVFLCGHYEGIDARALDTIVTDYVSIGDYVLTGGELPAMVMIDAIARLVPGVLHNEDSADTESLRRELLEYPQYSRPEVWQGMAVPEVLLCGDHRRIEEWRLEQSRDLTAARRPDLFIQYRHQETIIDTLFKNKRHNLHLIESLRRGTADLLYQNGEDILLYDADAGEYYIHGREASDGERNWMTDKDCQTLMERLETELAENTCGYGRFARRKHSQRPAWDVPDSLRIVIGQAYWKDPLIARFGSFCQAEYVQACYTQRCPLLVRHKDIRALDESALDFVTEHCQTEYREYLAERLLAGAMYGIYEGEQLVGFVGMHRAGCIGMLYIDIDYRRHGYGAALEAYCINRQLEAGMTPYLWIPAENEAARAMQEKLGLYLSKESIWELKKQQ